MSPGSVDDLLGLITEVELQCVPVAGTWTLGFDAMCTCGRELITLKGYGGGNPRFDKG